MNTAYLETRRHELRKSRLSMVDGNLNGNLRTVQCGISARAYHDGYWGFASAPRDDEASVNQVQREARANAVAMGSFGSRRMQALPGDREVGRQAAHGRGELPALQTIARLAELHAHCMKSYAGLRSTRLMATDEHHLKQLESADGSRSLARIQRAAAYVTLVTEGADGAPLELTEIVSGIGSLADLDWSLAAFRPKLDALYEHLRAKRQAVAARGGQQRVVMAPELAGILAHEAMGHPCEADSVLGGAVTGNLVGRPVASELVSMADLAHHFEGRELLCPVYVDDEGTPARDVTMIERGVLREFMHSRETAARMGLAPTGNARAYAPDDEPLVRMRNTAILPGSSTMQQMIEGVDEGYLLLKTGNGQADATTEFMFGVDLAYEIRGGKVGRAVRDTTVSGSALKVLQSVDAVGREIEWSCNGYCGKKQPMVVSVGGPALRALAHLGGE
ncbi:MAG: TldD/PmbA family protein [Burkholderiales bacterium]|nr:TldD/PmbA family protein [Burkholderiales bacterium]